MIGASLTWPLSQISIHPTCWGIHGVNPRPVPLQMTFQCTYSNDCRWHSPVLETHPGPIALGLCLNWHLAKGWKRVWIVFLGWVLTRNERWTLLDFGWMLVVNWNNVWRGAYWCILSTYASMDTKCAGELLYNCSHSTSTGYPTTGVCFAQLLD